jgi:glycolate oxidase
MSQYQQVNRQIIDQLTEICGKDQIVYGDAVSVEYTKDASNTGVPEEERRPGAVVTPLTAQAAADVVKLAAENHIAIIPRSAGTGLVGGCVPIDGGIVLSVEKLDHIIELDEDNRTLTAEAGVLTNSINEYLKDRKLFYAGFPMSLQSCMIGGNAATNAGGGKAVKYGVTGRHILGLEMVTPKGEVVWFGGKSRKDKAGYNLKDLVIGSEGTLGIITKVILNLERKPNSTGCSLVFFESNEKAAQAILKILSLKQVPSSLELFDRRSFIACNQYAKKDFDIGAANCVLLIAYEEETGKEVEAYLKLAEEKANEIGTLNVIQAKTPQEQDDIWSVRQSLCDADGFGSVDSVSEDFVVPFAFMPTFMDTLLKVENKYSGLIITNCGHAADGNLHTTFRRMPGISDTQWQDILAAAKHEIYLEIEKLGGKLTGEHGIGLNRVKFFSSVVNPVELELMKAIKDAWDPQHIMNPGKIFA